MTSSITTAETGARGDGTQQGIWGPGGTLTVWCLVFCLYRICSDHDHVVASTCQPFLTPSADHQELPRSLWCLGSGLEE